MEKTKKLQIAKRAADHALTLRNPLQDLQEAMAAKPIENAYVQQMTKLLEMRCKDMMQEAMTWITAADETERVEPSFTINDVKNAMADLVAKTRMLIYLLSLIHISEPTRPY